jgi:hypothetical protein
MKKTTGAGRYSNSVTLSFQQKKRRRRSGIYQYSHLYFKKEKKHILFSGL